MFQKRPTASTSSSSGSGHPDPASGVFNAGMPGASGFLPSGHADTFGGQGSASAAAARGGIESQYVPTTIAEAPALDLMSTRFALQLITQLGPKFNLRRDINNVITLTGRHLVWPTAVLTRLQQFLSRRCAESPAWSMVDKLSLEEFVQRHGIWNGLYDDSSLFFYLDEFVKLHQKDLLTVFNATIRELTQHLSEFQPDLLTNIDMLCRVLLLNATERELLVHASLCKYQRDLRPVMVDCKAVSAQDAYSMLAQVFGVGAADVSTSMRSGGRLETLGLIDTPIPEHAVTDLGDLMRVSDKLLAVLTEKYDSEQAMMAAFTRPAGQTDLTIGDYPHVEEDARYLAALLRGASRDRETGVNVLLYGPPGTGKTEFAKLVASLAGAELYAVECLDRDGTSLSGKDRYRSLQVSQAFLKSRQNTAILFDEVEDVFPPVSSRLLQSFGLENSNTSINGKAWVNQTLEHNPVPTIWVSNAIEQIDPAYRRRFQFHLELAVPPQSVRENIARKHLASLDVSDEFVEKIATRKQVTPAQIQAAARFARLVRDEVKEDTERLIERQLERSDRALGHMPDRSLRENPTQYALELLNVETRFPISKIIGALQARPRATLCFYGLPGTGKTALAEHIARQLDKPLMIRRASDLVSKYVGETEQQMAKMFQDAANEGAVLLLDEADSFLQNRQNAVRNYEVSEVNEMLQGMERFDGIFICTTNLFDRIDEAALRRFSFKLRFLPLTTQGRRQMFVTEALGGDESRIEAAHLTRLEALEFLTPGDFAAVVRQFRLLGDEVAPDEFLDQLEREHRAKPDVKFARPMGFTH